MRKLLREFSPGEMSQLGSLLDAGKLFQLSGIPGAYEFVIQTKYRRLDYEWNGQTLSLICSVDDIAESIKATELVEGIVGWTGGDFLKYHQYDVGDTHSILFLPRSSLL